MKWLEIILGMCLVLGYTCAGCTDNLAHITRQVRNTVVGDIRIGDDYKQALRLLELTGAEDLTDPFYCPRSSMDPDLRVTARFYLLSDGFKFTLLGSCPAGKRAGTNPTWTVDGMYVSGTAKSWYMGSDAKYAITRMAFRNGRSYSDLPPTALYTNLECREIERRMKPYGWKRKPCDPSEFLLLAPRPSTPRIPAIDRWESYALDGTELHLRFRRGGNNETLEEILVNGEIPFDIFDQYVLTTERYRKAIEVSLPKGWGARYVDMQFSDCETDIGICKAEEYGGIRGLNVRVLHPMTATEFAKHRASLPGLKARMAELEKAMAAFTKVTTYPTITPRNYKDQRIVREWEEVQRQIAKVPDFRTSKAAIRMPDPSGSEAEKYRFVMQAIRSALHDIDPLDPGDARHE